MINSVLRLKFEVRSLVAREPALAPLFVPFRWYMHLRGLGRATSREHRVGRHTEILIDGMQGSANSFVTAAFTIAQERAVEVCHHLHSPAQILKATRMDLPTLVTIREPIGSSLSLVSRWPYLSAKQALRGYLSFYGRILGASDRYVVGLFPVCTRELGSVIRAINRKFGTEFLPFEHTEENMRLLRNPAKLSSEREAARRELKKRISGEVEAAPCQPLLREAQELYRRFEALAPAPLQNGTTGSDSQRPV